MASRDVRVFWLSLSVATALWQPATADQRQVALKPGASAAMSFSQDSHHVAVELSSALLSPTDRVHSLLETADWYVPRSAISRVRILVDGQLVFVPLNAVADLYDVRSASIGKQMGEYFLDFVGGDGAQSYEARLFFDGEHVTRRVVGDIGLPRIFESSRYVLVVD